MVMSVIVIVIVIVRMIPRMQGINGVIISLAIKRLCCDDTINIFGQETSGLHISKTLLKSSLRNQLVVLIKNAIVIGILEHLIFFAIFLVNNKPRLALIKHPRVVVFLGVATTLTLYNSAPRTNLRSIIG